MTMTLIADAPVEVDGGAGRFPGCGSLSGENVGE